MEIHDFRTWPPGSMMKFDNMEPGKARHVSVGLVVSNDRTFISVVWDSISHTAFCRYEIKKLNRDVISKL